MKLIIEIDEITKMAADEDVLIGELTWQMEVKNAIKNGTPIQPCEDCISRAEVLSHAKTERGNGHEQPFDYVEADVIRQLPSVKPTEKVGQWIANGETFRCSECGELVCCQGRYCNECGTKMQEVEE